MSDNTPISHQLAPTPCWVDQFFAEPPSPSAAVNPSVVQPASTVFKPSVAQPAPAVAEPSPAATWNDGMAQAPGALHGLEDVEEWNEVVVEALHPWLARGGGNLAQSKESGKVFYVPMNKDEVLLYQPKASYERAIETLKQYIDALPSEAKKLGGVEQPLLHVREVRIPMALSNAIEQKIYGHRKGKKAFGQLLCNLGMRSSIDKKANVRTLTFDPNGWNRTGYRLIKGGDVMGGKPSIVPVYIYM